MILRKSAFLSFLLCLALALFTFACEKEEFTPNVEPGAVAVEARLAAALGKSLDQDSTAMDGSFDSVAYCFQFIFPLTFVTEDGGAYVIENEDADIDEGVLIADFAYPFTITFADGTAQEIADFNAFLAVLTACYGDFEEWDDEDWDYDHGDCPIDVDPEDLVCFDFVFPLDVTDGQTVTTLNNEDEFFAFVDGIDSTDAEGYDFVYPFEVLLLEDESTVMITDEEGFVDLLEDCYGFDGEWDDDYEDCIFDVDPEDILCFDFVFPLDVTDGQTVTTINNEDEFFAFAEGIDSTDAEGYDFVYPFEVLLLEDESTVTITDEEDFEDLLENCFDFDGEWDDDHGDCPIDVDPEDIVCFDFVFPLSVTDGQSVTTLTTEDEFFAFVTTIDSTTADDYDFVYPFDVLLLEDQSTVNIPDEEAFEDLLEDCDD